MTPTKPGFYYFRHHDQPRQYIWVAQVSRVKSGALFATVFSDLARFAVHHADVNEINGEWFGPLPPPETFER